MYVVRNLEPELLRFLEDREILIIRGPRQSGKTTLLKRIQNTLREKYDENDIIFITFEDPIEQANFAKNPREYLQFHLRRLSLRPKKRVFFLFDEIQYVPKSGKILKLLFDTFPQAKFIVTGSSTLDISQLGKYLVGRGLFFELYPFSFSEFLNARDTSLFLEYKEHRFSFDNPKKVESLHYEKLQRYFLEYLRFGGYPRVVLEPDEEKKKILLKNIFHTYIEKDILGLYGLQWKEKAVTTLQYLATASGSLIHFRDVCQITSLYFQELKEILQIFEETYIIRKVRPFHQNLITELKKNPKYYFLDLGLRNALLDRFDFHREELGGLFENYVFLILKDKNVHFWRTTAKAEVDFVIQERRLSQKEILVPIEVKASSKITRSFLSFLSVYNPQNAVLATLNASGVLKKNDTTVFIVPLALL